MVINIFFITMYSSLSLQEKLIITHIFRILILFQLIILLLMRFWIRDIFVFLGSIPGPMYTQMLLVVETPPRNQQNTIRHTNSTPLRWGKASNQMQRLCRVEVLRIEPQIGMYYIPPLEDFIYIICTKMYMM